MCLRSGRVRLNAADHVKTVDSKNDRLYFVISLAETGEVR